MAEDLHVLFGGGQVGNPLARILLGHGKRVRVVKRSPGSVPEGVELVRGDAAASFASTTVRNKILVLGAIFRISRAACIPFTRETRELSS